MPKKQVSKQEVGIPKLMCWFRNIFNRMKEPSHHLSGVSIASKNLQQSSEPPISPYFSNFDPSPTKLHMFFGRRREIEVIANHLRKGESVLLIGERRIGKTFFLHVIADLAKKGANFYTGLLDQETGKILAKFHQSAVSWQWVYVDMLSVTSPVGFYFNVLVGLAGGQKTLLGHIKELLPIDHMTFVEEIKKLSDNISKKGQRAVVLVDETEKLISLDQSASILSCLKNVVQQCDSIDFVFAGDIKQHQETQEFLSLKMALQPMYLGALNREEAKALIQVPVEGYTVYEEPTFERILELTGGKPSLIQVLCDGIFDLVVSGETKVSCITLDLLDDLWENKLRNRIFEKLDPTLRDFFEGLQGDDKDIFCFLAHHPRATIDDITKLLGISSEIANSCLQRLCMVQKVMADGLNYQIGSRIVQEYGSRFLVCPAFSQTRTMILPASLENMLKKDESATIEHKSSMRWDMQLHRVNKELEKSIAKSVAAFLNSDGGILIIGVADDGTIVGIEYDLPTLKKGNKDGYQLKLQEILSATLGAEYSCYYQVSFEETKDKTVCVLRIQPSPKPVYLTDQGKKEFYIRTGNMTQSLDIEASNNYIQMHWPT